MILLARLLAGGLGLFVLYNAFGYMVTPDSVLGLTSIEPIGKAGLNNVRANIGGPLLTTAFFLLYAAFTQKYKALIFAKLFFLSVMIGRVVGIVLDGYDPFSLRALVFATGLFVVTTISYVLFKRTGEKKAE